jgi:hypothetical protein
MIRSIRIKAHVCEGRCIYCIDWYCHPIDHPSQDTCMNAFARPTMHDTIIRFHYPGGKELASTKSSASFSISSFAACKGDRGSAIRPVRADSRMPKGEISFMKALIREGFAELEELS